jgi:hypothetical protein
MTPGSARGHVVYRRNGDAHFASDVDLTLASGYPTPDRSHQVVIQFGSIVVCSFLNRVPVSALSFAVGHVLGTCSQE